jgi:hypothetical protein
VPNVKLNLIVQRIAVTLEKRTVDDLEKELARLDKAEEQRLAEEGLGDES